MDCRSSEVQESMDTFIMVDYNISPTHLIYSLIPLLGRFLFRDGTSTGGERYDVQVSFTRSHREWRKSSS